MSNFYTNVQVRGNSILYRGIDNGRRYQRKIDYYPTLYVPSKEHTGFTTIHGDMVSPIQPGSIRDCKDFVERYKDVDGFPIYGMQRYEYAYIADEFPDEELHWDKQYLNITNIDIEVGSENGFPEPDEADNPITAIALKNNHGKFIVFGCGDFNNKRDDVDYRKCRDEIDLIKRFIDEWTGNYPDVVTGWHSKYFDIPYLVNRIVKLLGEDWAKRLSPWNSIYAKIEYDKDQELKSFVLIGLAQLDYMLLYKKFAPGGVSKDSHSLENICSIELGERKLSYTDHTNLFRLLDTKSRDIMVPADKPKEELREFEKWVKLKKIIEGIK